MTGDTVLVLAAMSGLVTLALGLLVLRVAVRGTVKWWRGVRRMRVELRWARALIERTPCTCSRLYYDSWARCERCDFLRGGGWLIKEEDRA